MSPALPQKQPTDKRPPTLPGATKRLFLSMMLLAAHRLDAQIREKPVAFDSAARVTTITPPLAARLGLSAPVWPVQGEYVDARLYWTNTADSTFVIVVHRQHEILERYPLVAAQRRALAATIDAANVATRQSDSLPTYISEPVRGAFLLNQGMLGVGLFGPAAALASDDPSTSLASYLAVAGATFFVAGNMTNNTPISRAQNHLAWHSARRGAIAANLLGYSLSGELSRQNEALATLAGGIAGDVVGFYLAKPMTDAEAHGTSHGSTITAVLATGLLGSANSFHTEAGRRLASGAIVAAGAIGYPLGLAYVRNAPYRVTAGDVGTLVTTELLGVTAAASLLDFDHGSETVAFGVLTAGFAAGAIAGDRFFVRPSDFTESEARMIQFGAGAGALMGLAVPVLAQTSNAHAIVGAIALGGVLGTVLAQNFVRPLDAKFGAIFDKAATSRVGIQVSPEGALLAGMKAKGSHSIVSLTF